MRVLCDVDLQTACRFRLVSQVLCADFVQGFPAAAQALGAGRLRDGDLMDSNTTELLRRIRQSERDLESALADWREVPKAARARAVRFTKTVRAEQKKLRRNLLQHIRSIGLLYWLTAPVIYGMIIPLALVDLFATFYQRVCFPVYGVARVRRADYVVIDRHRLGYLNLIEKLNCVYCGYGNGVIAYVREVASRTEQFFCPIKHALPVPGAHDRYGRFVEYGDAKAYRDQIDHLRKTAGEL